MTTIEPPEPLPSWPDLTNLYVDRRTGRVRHFEDGPPAEQSDGFSETQVGLCRICLQETSRPEKFGSYLGSKCRPLAREHSEHNGPPSLIISSPYGAAHSPRPVALVMNAWQVYCLREYTKGVAEAYLPITDVFERARTAGDSQWHFERAEAWIKRKYEGKPMLMPSTSPQEAIAFMMGKHVEDIVFPSRKPDDTDE